jgi:hypothetical protein
MWDRRGLWILNLPTPLNSAIAKGVAMIFCWGGPDFKPKTDAR